MTNPAGAGADRDSGEPSADGPTFLIVFSCPDRIGIVADVSRFLVDNRCNILDSAQFGDPGNNRFFMRTTFRSLAGIGLDSLKAAFRPIAEKHAMEVSFHDLKHKVPALIMVSRFGHCLNDLLYRCRIGALPIDIRGIVSNHQDFADVAHAAGIPYHHLPVSPANREIQENKVSDIIDAQGIDLVVLARYMQILSPKLCAKMAGRLINIHHSFLPSFKGARPYQQAYERGVKLIGATAHYVTGDLDDGPIIDQAVLRVSHAHRVEDYAAAGRDIETIVLARAVKWHAEHRILVNGKKTVVFE
jgi:formyltetrahydrofolate deformylase